MSLSFMQKLYWHAADERRRKRKEPLIERKRWKRKSGSITYPADEWADISSELPCSANFLRQLNEWMLQNKWIYMDGILTMTYTYTSSGPLFWPLRLRKSDLEYCWKLCFKTLKANFKTLKANIFLRGISTYTSIRRITKDEDMTS